MIQSSIHCEKTSVCYSIEQALVNGYLVMTASSNELREQGQWMRPILFKFRMIAMAFCTLHAMYFATFGVSPECGSFELRLFLITYPLFTILFLRKDYVYRTNMNANYVQKDIDQSTKLAD